jgi:hypothetical protein
LVIPNHRLCHDHHVPPLSQIAFPSSMDGMPVR